MLLATAQAAERLARHHGSMAPQSGWAQHVLNGPKMPHWGCSCGEAENWASRLQCRGCGKSAPGRVAAAAKEAAKVPQPQHRGPKGAWAKGPPVPDEVAKLRKEVAGLKLQLKQNQTTEVDDKVEDPEDEASTRREKIQKELDSLKAVLGSEHPEVQARITQLDELQRQRPLGTRLLAAQRKIAKTEKKLEQKRQSVAEVSKDIEEFQQKLKDLQGESEAMQKELDSQKADQARLLEAEESSEAPGSTAAEWEQFQRMAGKLSGAQQAPGPLVEALRAVQQTISEWKSLQAQSDEAGAEQQDFDMDKDTKGQLSEQQLVEALGARDDLGSVLGSLSSDTRRKLAESLGQIVEEPKRRKVGQDAQAAEGVQLG